MWLHYIWYRIEIRYQINTVPTPTVAWTRAWLLQGGGVPAGGGGGGLSTLPGGGGGRHAQVRRRPNFVPTPAGGDLTPKHPMALKYTSARGMALQHTIDTLLHFCESGERSWAGIRCTCGPAVGWPGVHQTNLWCQNLATTEASSALTTTTRYTPTGALAAAAASLRNPLYEPHPSKVSAPENGAKLQLC